MKKVLTYGTYDLLHIGHLNLLRRAKALGDWLIVGLSTDEFNTLKNKQSFLPYQQRKDVLEAIRFVDQIIPEQTWGQKEEDILLNAVDILVMGDDWEGKFDHLRAQCEVIYLPRTKDISTTSLKADIREKITSTAKTL